ncbi:hypothetical protein Avbf_11367 [Armadillidium vulgare]|nr:hypothetical protein Avbf_11367 [Armadillidium vulgare]
MREARIDIPPKFVARLWGARHTLAVMLFFALSCNYALRVNLSVAIVAMVNHTTSSPDNTSTSDQCPYPEDKDTADDYNESGKILAKQERQPVQHLFLRCSYKSSKLYSVLASRESWNSGPYV